MSTKWSGFVSKWSRGGRKPDTEAAAGPNAVQPSVPAEPAGGAADSKGYEYDPELVPRLKQDHRNLVRQFGELGGYIRRGDSAQRFVREVLQPGFSSHLILEHYFYTSLEAHTGGLDLGDDPEIWRQFRLSMKDIARAVNRFLSEIVTGRINDMNRIDYLRRYQEIMEILGKRISDEEERLYVIYERHLGGRAVERPKQKQLNQEQPRVVHSRFGGDSKS